MVLYIIGLGLYNEKDISVRGLEIVTSADYVFMEYYTSVLGIDIESLQKFYQREILLADREVIENDFDTVILEKAVDKKVALLVVGDPLSATTHIDLFLRATKIGVKVEVLNNASIINACGLTGLSLYRFGEAITIPFFNKNWRPYSFYEKILKNYKNDQHTLVLLDIKLREVSDENLLRGKKIYEPPRFMSVNVAIEQIIEAEEKTKLNFVSKDLLCFGVARLGAPDQKIVSGNIFELQQVDFGKPLHSLIICAPTLHSIEQEMFKFYHVSNNK